MTQLPASFLKAPIAHRAFHDLSKRRPENSRAAVQAAIDAGYGIEIDLQISSDGQAMVFHDYVLDRLTAQKGTFNQRTAAELGQIALEGGDEMIPTLQQVLDLVAGRVPLLIEIKDQDGRLGGSVGRLEQATAEVLQGYQGDVALMSFNPHSVQKMASLCPDIPRGLTTCNFAPYDWPLIPAATRDRLKEIPDYDALGCDFISHFGSELDAPRVTDLKTRGAKILCWTIRSTEAEAEARKIAHNVTFEGYDATVPA